jgi:CheY-like chemotaxis protein
MARGGADVTGENQRPVVLLVDDEPAVLETLSMQLRRDHHVVTAGSGRDALRLLEDCGPVAAVISDMRMPGMDGIELLSEVQLHYPDTIRILHTAQQDTTSAIAAINEVDVFRYLSKPCQTADLRKTLHDAVERHWRATTERELLDKTLRASLQALFGCLELASPAAFARAGRIRSLVAALCLELGLTDLWEIEVAAMASQLGAVTIPTPVLEKLNHGRALSVDEQAMVDAMPDVAVRLLADVPNLHEVVEIVRGLAPERVVDQAASPLVTTAVKVVRAAIDFETLESRGLGVESAIAVLECRDAGQLHILGALRAVKGIAAVNDEVRALHIAELEVGMRLAEDIVAVNGLVLIGRGMTVTNVMLDRLANFRRTVELVEPVLTGVPGVAA